MAPPKPAKPARPSTPKGPKAPKFKLPFKLPGAPAKRDPNIPRHWDDVVRSVLKLVTYVVVLALAVFLVTVWMSWRRPLPAGDHALGHTGLWLAPTWTASFHDPTDFDSLASELATYAITDVFVDVGSLNAQGTLPPAGNPYVANMLSQLRAAAPGVRIWASVGGRPSEDRAGGTVNLGRPAVASAVVSTTTQLLGLGFNGIHVNLSPVTSGDKALVTLIGDIHAVARAKGALLSVEGAEAEPVGGAARIGRALSLRQSGYRPWTFGYYRQVAAQTDQIIVRASGSGLPTPWTYGSYVGWETHELLAAIGGRTPLLFDISTRARGSMSHQPWAENIGSGIRGVRHGLRGASPAARSRVGIAIRDQLTASPADFATLGRNWVCTASGAPACSGGIPPVAAGVQPGAPGGP